MPSLRERIDDIPLLVSFFAKQLSARDNLKEKPIDEEVFLEFKRYAWPGNVRELHNVLSRMLIMSGERVTVEDLPDEILAVPEIETNGASALKEFRDRAERDHIVGVLKKNNGNITQAAAGRRTSSSKNAECHTETAETQSGKETIRSALYIGTLSFLSALRFCGLCVIPPNSYS